MLSKFGMPFARGNDPQLCKLFLARILHSGMDLSYVKNYWHAFCIEETVKKCPLWVVKK